MKPIKLHVKYTKILADTITPVGVYLNIRDKFPKSILLESSEYNSKANSISYICFQPIASFIVKNGIEVVSYPNGEIKQSKTDQPFNELKTFLDGFLQEGDLPNGIENGLFGYCAYDSVKYLEPVEIKSYLIPDICYYLYKYVIAIDHFHNEAYVISNCHNADEDGITSVLQLLRNGINQSFEFTTKDEETSSTSEQEFLEQIQLAKQHCALGDVFQMVLSRRYNQKFQGDDFCVYRALRSINPSPYLFYFDLGDFRLFGSSPESQLTIENNKASIFPIAGTFKKTGVQQIDNELADKLLADPKENAEHTMLVDLARNDLNRFAKNVKVETYKAIQHFSHVIHMVSKVTGQVDSDDSINLLSSTFPTGTLSGAPKVKAMQLINYYEKESRGFYGGTIGMLGFNGNVNHAIMIRSVMSRDNVLHYQAGAGVVTGSVPVNELKEVDNKLGAVRKAIQKAQTNHQKQELCAL